VSGIWIRTADTRDIAGCKAKWEEEGKRPFYDEAGYSGETIELVAICITRKYHSRKWLPALYVMAVRIRTEPLAPFIHAPSVWFVLENFLEENIAHKLRTDRKFSVHLHPFIECPRHKLYPSQKFNLQQAS
jgi:hypothetical protein